jgi:hypothetical protein
MPLLVIQLSEFLGGIKTRLQAVGPRDLGTVPGKARCVSILHSFHTGNVAYHAAYAIGTRDYIPVI